MSETLASRTARAIGNGARVLHLGCVSCAPLLERLHARSCRITVVLDAAAAISDAGLPHCERIVRGDIEQAEVRRQLMNEAFNAVIVSGLLMRTDDPIQIMKSLAPLLAETGYLVGTVPAIAPGTAHLGGFAAGAPVPPARRFYTRETLESLFEACGFVIGRIDRVEDAQSSHFIVVAFHLPEPRPSVFNDRVHGLVRRCEVMEQKLRHLATETAPHTADVDPRRPIPQDGDVAATERALEGLSEQLHVTRNQVQLMQKSFSWRLTAPLRVIARWLGRTTTDTILGRRT